MAWCVTGEWIEACSCEMMCRCVLGPTEPDQGWCSASLVFGIRQGNSDGVDLANTKVAFALDLPGDFMGGNGTARVYIDEAANADQRRELEAIFTGKKGGVLEALSHAVAKWLPTQTTSIDFHTGDNPSATVGSVAQLKLQRLKTEAGRQTKVLDAPLFGAFQVESEDLARSDGSRWSDPEMRRWEAGGHGGVVGFNWSA
jgi:hypothetical protein